MKIIGLTGGIACGKSTVSAYLKQKGAFIIDGDAIARQLSEPKKSIWQAYVNHFGDKVLNADNSLNRRLIGQIVFTDEKEKTWMNTTMHPLIRDEIVKQIDECRQNGIEVVILDIPLLYEANWDKFADEVWVVKISRQLQIERIQNRDGLTKEEAIIKAEKFKTQKYELPDDIENITAKCDKGILILNLYKSKKKIKTIKVS